MPNYNADLQQNNAELDQILQTVNNLPLAGDIGLGMTGATVGQIARIKAVDAAGKVTEWEPVDIPGGAAEPEWEQFAEITVTPENASNRYVWDIPLSEKVMLTTQYNGRGDKDHWGSLLCTDARGLIYPAVAIRFYLSTLPSLSSRSALEIKSGIIEGMGSWGANGGVSYSQGMNTPGEILRTEGFTKAFCKDNSGNMLPGTIIRLYIIRK